MSQTWSELLVADHDQTEKVIDALETLWSDRAPEPATVARALRYFNEFADACHNQKEELHLFPRLQAAGMPAEGGPLAVNSMAPTDGVEQLTEPFRRRPGAPHAFSKRRAVHRSPTEVLNLSQHLLSSIWKVLGQPRLKYRPHRPG